jgi:6-phosphofructokinase
MCAIFQRDINLIFACHFQTRRLDMLFVLGGNGTHAGANAIHEEVCVFCILIF